jgi:uncharacterized protein
MIKRSLKKKIISRLQPNKVIVIYGPRQVGKTTLVKELLKEINEKYLFVSGEDRRVHSWLSSQSIEIYKQYIGTKKLLVIDEAQKVDQIGLNLKIIVDNIKGLKIIATGSSSFDLANQVGEPLVGRKWQYILYPVSQMELGETENLFQTQDMLPTRLIFGAYPGVITAPSNSEKMDLLNSIVDGYLFKDLLVFDGIKKSQQILHILKLIAFQIGFEVSLSEIGTQVHLDLRTVEKYLDLLEKAFVIKRIYGYSGNLRSEVTKNSRFYFLDNGIRNTIINNFNDLNTRNDIGQLWENYLFIERLKKQHYKGICANNFFWRTYDKKEIDFIEERGGKLFGYEFKWGKKKQKPPALWGKTYKNAVFQIINQKNYLDFIT